MLERTCKKKFLRLGILRYLGSVVAIPYPRSCLGFTGQVPAAFMYLTICSPILSLQIDFAILTGLQPYGPTYNRSAGCLQHMLYRPSDILVVFASGVFPLPCLSFSRVPRMTSKVRPTISQCHLYCTGLEDLDYLFDLRCRRYHWIFSINSRSEGPSTDRPPTYHDIRD